MYIVTIILFLISLFYNVLYLSLFFWYHSFLSIILIRGLSCNKHLATSHRQNSRWDIWTPRPQPLLTKSSHERNIPKERLHRLIRNKKSIFTLWKHLMYQLLKYFVGWPHRLSRLQRRTPTCSRCTRPLRQLRPILTPSRRRQASSRTQRQGKPGGTSFIKMYHKTLCPYSLLLNSNLLLC